MKKLNKLSMLIMLLSLPLSYSVAQDLSDIIIEPLPEVPARAIAEDGDIEVVTDDEQIENAQAESDVVFGPLTEEQARELAESEQIEEITDEIEAIVNEVQEKSELASLPLPEEKVEEQGEEILTIEGHDLL